MCEGGVGESRRSDFSDQHRLHGSIHYPGYLKDVNVRQKNKSMGPAIYFPGILDSISAKWVPSRRSVAHPEPADWRRRPPRVAIVSEY